jgi:hypothetical protein
MMTHSPAYILSQLLIDLELATAATDNDDWSIYRNTLPDSPDSCIAIYDRTPIHHGRCGVNNEVKEHFGVQIIIRGATQSVAYAKSESIREALDETIDKNSVTILTSTYLVFSTSLRSGPISLGNEENTARFLFSINFITAIRQTI